MNTALLSNGSHTLSALATDNYGNTATAPSVTFTVQHGGGGMIVGSGPTAPSAAGLSGYTPSRPQIDYPNGTIVYLGATTTASTSPPTAPTTIVSSTPITTPAAVFASSSPFLIDRQLWDEGPDILALEQFLNTHGFPLVATGWGSPGNETDTFGLHTYAALVKFQKANNLPATGYFGPLDRMRRPISTASRSRKSWYEALCRDCLRLR